MALLVRIYFNAVFGALGGLLGWMLFGIFGDKSFSSVVQQLLGGAFIGGLIGYFVVSVEAIRDRSARFDERGHERPGAEHARGVVGVGGMDRRTRDRLRELALP